jgi:hypothetical protein
MFDTFHAPVEKTGGMLAITTLKNGERQISGR